MLRKNKKELYLESQGLGQQDRLRVYYSRLKTCTRSLSSDVSTPQQALPHDDFTLGRRTVYWLLIGSFFGRTSHFASKSNCCKIYQTAGVDETVEDLGTMLLCVLIRDKSRRRGGRHVDLMENLPRIPSVFSSQYWKRLCEHRISGSCLRFSDRAQCDFL